MNDLYGALATVYPKKDRNTDSQSSERFSTLFSDIEQNRSLSDSLGSFKQKMFSSSEQKSQEKPLQFVIGKMNDEELQEMVDRADSNGDGAVTLDDFFNIMTKKTFA